MCGFAGEFCFGGGRADVAVARSMARRLAHRGPDESASFVSADGRCAIGFRRLAVIDPEGSHQPMSLPDGSVTVACNGEIYNFRDLRRELTAQGARFLTAGDTEVLLHLYRRDGDDMLRHLVGMFAFALYDARQGRLLLARDRLGQKPLCCARLADRVVFASEAKALSAHPQLSCSVDEDAITSYMTMGYIPAPASGWQGVLKLLPAHKMLLDNDLHPQTPYWSPRAVPLPAKADARRELVREALSEAVAARMVSDVPLGALLSGGLDSAVVVALMCRAAGRAGGVRTFTAGFEDPLFDERPDARRLAEHCGTDHTELLVRPDPAGIVDDVLDRHDEPFGDSSALPTFLICRQARRHVTVALSGDGGDEVFAGYDRYRAVWLADRTGPARYLAARLASHVLRLVAPLEERHPLRRFVRFADALPHPPAVQYFMHRRLFGPADLERLLTDDFLSRVDVEAPARWFCDLYESADLDEEVTYAQRHDMMTYLPDDILVKTDIASMASSLELRSPLLDHRVVNLGLSLPVAEKVDRRQGKLILRRAFSAMLPPEVFRRRKRGFGVPLAQWLRGELLETLRETLLDEGLARRGIFRKQALAGLINDHVSRRCDHRHRLWALLVLARWLGRQGP